MNIRRAILYLEAVHFMVLSGPLAFEGEAPGTCWALIICLRSQGSLCQASRASEGFEVLFQHFHFVLFVCAEHVTRRQAGKRGPHCALSLTASILSDSVSSVPLPAYDQMPQVQEENMSFQASQRRLKTSASQEHAMSLAPLGFPSVPSVFMHQCLSKYLLIR